MSRAVLKGKGDITKISEFLIKDLQCDLVSKTRRKTDEGEIILLVFEEYYFRMKSSKALTVLLSGGTDELIADVVSAGGAIVDWGAGGKFVSKAVESLSQHGFYKIMDR